MHILFILLCRVFRVTHLISFLSLADKVLIVLAEWAILLNYKQVSEDCVLVPKPKALGSELHPPTQKQTLNAPMGRRQNVLPVAGNVNKRFKTKEKPVVMVNYSHNVLMD